VTKVLASRDDVNTVYVTFSGYRFGEDDGHVYKSTDAGANWIDISTNLPDIPVNDIERDRYGNLFLGTDIGVLASLDEGTNWEVLGMNMPSVVVTDLNIHEASEFLFAGTYGRSSYKIDIANNILNTDDILFALEVQLYPNPSSDYVMISIPEDLENVSVILYDQLGREIIRQDFTDYTNDIRFSIETIPSGLYYLSIFDGISQTTKKLLVK